MFAEHLSLKRSKFIHHSSRLGSTNALSLFFFLLAKCLTNKICQTGIRPRRETWWQVRDFRALDGYTSRFWGKWFLHEGREYIYKGRKRNSTTDDVERETTPLGFFFQYVYYFLNNNFNRSLYIFQSFYIRWIVV